MAGEGEGHAVTGQGAARREICDRDPGSGDGLEIGVASRKAAT